MGTTGFHIRYRSFRDFIEDYSAYIQHGGIVVPWAERGPVVNSVTVVRVELPTSARWDLLARIVRVLDGKNFMAAFEEASFATKKNIDTEVAEAIRFAAQHEAPSAPRGRDVALFTPEAAVAEAPRLPLVPSGNATLAKPAVEDIQAEMNPLTGWFEENTPADGVEPPAVTDPAAAEALPLDDETADGTAPPPEAEEEELYLGSITMLQAPPTAAQETSFRTSIQPGGSAAAKASIVEDAIAASQPKRARASVPPDTVQDESYFPKPGPGEHYVVYIVKYAALLDFAETAASMKETAFFTVPHAGETDANPGELAQLRLTLPGHNVFTMFSVIDSVDEVSVGLRLNPNDPQFRLAINFLTSVHGSKRLAGETEADRGAVTVLRLTEQRPTEDVDKMPLKLRLQRMSTEDKINLALSGDREERMALANDTNKAIHHYLLKNAKLSIDEVAFMARMPSINPDVLSRIAENPAYTQNPQVTKGLIYNPKTPILVAIRLIDRLPRSEIMLLAKRTTMNLRLVMAAKKKLEGGERR